MVILGLFAALLYGLGDFAGGFAARKSSIIAVLLVSQAAGAVLALAFCLVWGGPPASSADLARGLAAGASGLLGIAMLYGGIARLSVAIVSPLSALLGAALPFAYGLAKGESPSPTAVAGALLCFPAIILLSLGGRGEQGKGLVGSSILYGSLAGLGFGGFFIILSGTDPGSGLWPVVGARVSSVSIVLCVALGRAIAGSRAEGSRKGGHSGGRRGGSPGMPARAGRLGLHRRALPLIVAVGLADMGANILFILATRVGLLSTVSVITSLFPAPTVLMSRIALKERIPPLRVAGLALAIGGVALMSVGAPMD